MSCLTRRRCLPSLLLRRLRRRPRLDPAPSQPPLPPTGWTLAKSVPVLAGLLLPSAPWVAGPVAATKGERSPADSIPPATPSPLPPSALPGSAPLLARLVPRGARPRRGGVFVLVLLERARTGVTWRPLPRTVPATPQRAAFLLRPLDGAPPTAVDRFLPGRANLRRPGAPFQTRALPTLVLRSARSQSRCSKPRPSVRRERSQRLVPPLDVSALHRRTGLPAHSWPCAGCSAGPCAPPSLPSRFPSLSVQMAPAPSPLASPVPALALLSRRWQTNPPFECRRSRCATPPPPLP